MKNLIINPGSTSSKIAVYEKESAIFSKTIRHPQNEIEVFPHVIDQKQYRLKAIMDTLGEHGIDLAEISLVIAIGGFLQPSVAGVFEVNEEMLRDLASGNYGEHASNLGGIIAAEIAANLKVKAYIADPVTTDEMQDVARLSGLPEVVRVGKTHTLNQKAVAAMAARELGLPRESCNLVVVHLGGGISIAAHRGMQMVDTSDPRGEGPLCIDRPGGVHAFEVAKLCYSGKYTKDEMLKMLSGGGGVVAYMHTRDFFEVMRRYNEKDPMAIAVYNAMAYQIAKEIGSELAVLKGKADAIVFTGGMSRETCFIEEIKSYIGSFAKVLVYPGEFEMEALAAYAVQVQGGEIKPNVYIGKAG